MTVRRIKGNKICSTIELGEYCVRKMGEMLDLALYKVTLI